MLRARESVYRLVLAVADAAAFVGAYLLAYEARQNLFAAHFSKGMEPFAAYGVVLPYLVVTWIVFLALAGVYEVRLRGLNEFVAILKGTFFGCVALLAAAGLYHEFVVSRGFVFFLFPLLVVITPLSRAAFRKVRRVVFRQTDSIIRLAFVGRNELSSRLAAEVKALDVGYRVVGCMTDERA
ncbi:MAG: hypothetical protein RDV41_09980, partial [Planctomycetota bacterium]|nr:hypothetical protein [Planctomycetota bacterium]